MPDFPHRGPNASRIPVEGVGGFLFALTPLLVLLFGAPWLLVAWLGVGVVLAPFAYWRHHSAGRSLTHFTLGVSGIVFGLLALFVTVADPRMRLFAFLCVAGGLIGAVVRAARVAQVSHPSIRDHNQR